MSLGETTATFSQVPFLITDSLESHLQKYVNIGSNHVYRFRKDDNGGEYLLYHRSRLIATRRKSRLFPESFFQSKPFITSDFLSEQSSEEYGANLPVFKVSSYYNFFFEKKFMYLLKNIFLSDFTAREKEVEDHSRGCGLEGVR